MLEFDATDDLVRGNQEGSHVNGYYDNFCFLRADRGNPSAGPSAQRQQKDCGNIGIRLSAIFQNGTSPC
ncbi:MAG: hypothetical protein ABI831_27745 [Betaproteobacteria bacterium]